MYYSNLGEVCVKNLLEQFKGHIINQTLTNKLSEIEILLAEDELNEIQKESVLAY